MSQEIDVKTFFRENTSAELKGVTNRAVTAIRRAKIETMDALCSVSIEELERARGMGAKSLELALLMCEKYTAQ